MFKLIQQVMSGKLIGIALIVVFTSVLFLSLFNLPMMDMDMASNSSGCPFMTHEATLCLNVLDHVGAWKSAFLAAVPGFTLLLSILATAVVLLTIAPNLLTRQTYRIPLPSRDFVERVYTFSYRPLQELFSSGILHPKLF